MNKLKKYYSTQSVFSDPRKYIKLYDSLPDEIPQIIEILQGLVMPFDWLDEVPTDRRSEMNARHVSKILTKIIELSNEPLTEKRPLYKRFLGCCRDLSLLLCSIARHKGIPARIRSGFAPYINIGAPSFNPEHLIAEVWDYDKERWRIVDAGQNEELIRINRIDFDVTDIPPDNFLLSGQAWIEYRQGKIDPNSYGVEPDSRFIGESMIRNRLIQDLAMLNKQELLIWDAYGLMDLHIEPTEDDLILLDRVADITTTYCNDLDKVKGIYEKEARLQVSNVVSTYSPFDAPRVVDLTRSINASSGSA